MTGVTVVRADREVAANIWRQCMDECMYICKRVSFVENVKFTKQQQLLTWLRDSLCCSQLISALQPSTVNT